MKKLNSTFILFCFFFFFTILSRFVHAAHLAMIICFSNQLQNIIVELHLLEKISIYHIFNKK